ncbi:hypothetical protein LTR36_010897 [Oleoguttula mirabilis]|uniref:Uncharacterized protein n=1 Tax=Oleoguttula mirabilis TaxID=1507867 RepID=A0AAV9J3L8_9PEZI|nr:hypothetical protein LTR36_010897 [Oleoguttula mirabilis]
MAQARAKYAANPKLVAQIRANALARLAKPLPLTPEDFDFTERVDCAISSSSRLLDQARAQLAAPNSDFLPAELTPDEVAEREAVKKWEEGRRLAEGATDSMFERNQTLFDDVIGLTAAIEQAGLPMPSDIKIAPPPPTPTLEHLNVPQQVKAWIAEAVAASNKPLVKSQAPITETDPSIAALQQRINVVSARLAKARNDGDYAERRASKARVPGLVALYDGFAPCRATRQDTPAAHMPGTAGAQRKNVEGELRGADSKPMRERRVKWKNVWSFEIQVLW